jgi:hypothetical protein
MMFSVNARGRECRLAVGSCLVPENDYVTVPKYTCKLQSLSIIFVRAAFNFSLVSGAPTNVPMIELVELGGWDYDFSI